MDSFLCPRARRAGLACEGVSIMFHAPKMNIFWVVGASVGLYLLDWITGYFFCIRYCPTLRMTRLGETAVEVVFKHPPGQAAKGAKQRTTTSVNSPRPAPPRPAPPRPPKKEENPRCPASTCQITH